MYTENANNVKYAGRPLVAGGHVIYFHHFTLCVEAKRILAIHRRGNIIALASFL